jgi:hypothetical protein
MNHIFGTEIVRLLSLIVILSGSSIAAIGLAGYLAGRHSHTICRAMLLIGVGMAMEGFGLVARPSPTWFHHAVIMSGIGLFLMGDVVLLTNAKRRLRDKEMRDDARRQLV